QGAVSPMPGNSSPPSVPESWTLAKDGVTYEFVIRKNAKFHNGDPVTAEDVKFTFERYKGSGAKLLKDRVKEVQGADPYKFASSPPGVELTVDAFPDYWRKAPQVKRLVMRSIPDESTRAAAVK